MTIFKKNIFFFNRTIKVGDVRRQKKLIPHLNENKLCTKGHIMQTKVSSYEKVWSETLSFF